MYELLSDMALWCAFSKLYSNLSFPCCIGKNPPSWTSASGSNINCDALQRTWSSGNNLPFTFVLLHTSVLFLPSSDMPLESLLRQALPVIASLRHLASPKQRKLFGSFQSQKGIGVQSFREAIRLPPNIYVALLKPEAVNGSANHDEVKSLTPSAKSSDSWG